VDTVGQSPEVIDRFTELGAGDIEGLLGIRR
jgi:hypothetical protein